MPEVKWVDPNIIRAKKNTIAVCPVLTLDQLEAWLKEERGWYYGTHHTERVPIFDRLLAQVQAWKADSK